MSVEAISWALKQKIKPSTTKFVLVAIANCADGKDAIAWPSVGYLVDATGQDRKTVMAAISRLIDMGYLRDTGERRGQTRQVIVYQLTEPADTSEQSQKRNCTESGTVPEFPLNGTEFPPKEDRNSLGTVPKTGHGTINEPSMNRKEPSKRRVKAEPIVLPDWLDPEDWARWDRFRKKKSGKGWTDDAMAFNLRTLTTLRNSGHDPKKVIEQSIERGWTGLFELKKPIAGAAKHANFANQNYRAGVRPDGSF